MSSVDHDDEPMGWSLRFREYRHNSCLMRPLSALITAVFCLFSLVVAIFHIPGVVLGFLLSPILRRTPWLIEFVYPTGIARWAHFFLLKSSMSAKNITPDKGHSRTAEQRIEVVKGRVYIHPITQLLDNIAYLVVCCPPPSSATNTIVGFLLDCGDATAALHQIHAVRELHYPNAASLEIQAILCTHKHHDHTAGNKDLLQHKQLGLHITSVFGGAVEKVPHCNSFVKNKEILSLPQVEGNDMNDVVQVEVIAVPAHTRGSVVYALRPTGASHINLAASYLFTGDTMFSGGAGVPFEADVESSREKRTSNKNANSPIRASAGSKAVERCFVEILHRGLPTTQDSNAKDATSRMLIFPGHEYTSDIIGRQFHMQDAETARLSRQPPSVFFETASQLFVSLHRRSLPQGGKLLCIPSPMSRELVVNPSFRTLTRRCQHVVRAVRLWHRLFAKSEAVVDGAKPERRRQLWLNKESNGLRSSPPEDVPDKTPSTATHWNVSAQDVNRPVFTTVFADDLQTLIHDLASSRVEGTEAAERLVEMQAKLNEPATGRRPIPNTLPSEKNMYLGVLAFAMLGSPPCAMTLSDSRSMNLPAPMRGGNSDPILISKRRLLSMLDCFGFLTADDGGDSVIPLIHLLWKEALEYGAFERGGASAKKRDDVEVADDEENSDRAELGVLRWMLYGVETNQPSWAAKLCMPCSNDSKQVADKMPRNHPIEKLSLRRTGGELVRHDVLTCLLCRHATGCPEATHEARNNGRMASLTLEQTRDVAPEENGIEAFPSVTEEADDLLTAEGMELVHLPKTLLLQKT